MVLIMEQMEKGPKKCEDGENRKEEVQELKKEQRQKTQVEKQNSDDLFVCLFLNKKGRN